MRATLSHLLSVVLKRLKGGFALDFVLHKIEKW